MRDLLTSIRIIRLGLVLLCVPVLMFFREFQSGTPGPMMRFVGSIYSWDTNARVADFTKNLVNTIIKNGLESPEAISSVKATFASQLQKGHSPVTVYKEVLQSQLGPDYLVNCWGSNKDVIDAPPAPDGSYFEISRPKTEGKLLQFALGRDEKCIDCYLHEPASHFSRGLADKISVQGLFGHDMVQAIYQTFSVSFKGVCAGDFAGALANQLGSAYKVQLLCQLSDLNGFQGVNHHPAEENSVVLEVQDLNRPQVMRVLLNSKFQILDYSFQSK